MNQLDVRTPLVDVDVFGQRATNHAEFDPAKRPGPEGQKTLAGLIRVDSSQ